MSKADEPIVQHPDVRLEDVRGEWKANECTGRGEGTAAPRGYNTERLAGAVLDPDRSFVAFSNQQWADTYIGIDREVPIWVECKSCIYRYPSGGYGRFRIWRKHHSRLYYESAVSNWPAHAVYFFVVYTVEYGIEKEVGKLVVPVEQVDDVIEEWTVRNHSSMGEEEAKDISWRVLLKRLGVLSEQFETDDLIDLTNGLSSMQDST